MALKSKKEPEWAIIESDLLLTGLNRPGVEIKSLREWIINQHNRLLNIPGEREIGMIIILRMLNRMLKRMDKTVRIRYKLLPPPKKRTPKKKKKVSDLICTCNTGYPKQCPAHWTD